MMALALGLALAAADAPPPLPPPDSWVPRHAATLRVLDKVEATVQTVTIAAGSAQQVGTLRIAVGGCYVRPPELPADATAKLTVVDPSAPGGAPLFDGWMLLKEPAIGVLEHPVYDVQLAGCT